MSTKEKDPLLGDEGEGKEEPKEPKAKPAAKMAETPSVATPAATVGVKSAVTPAKANETTIAETKAILATKPKINFIIPLAEGEKDGAFDTVQINGYMLTIKKGVMVELPMPVAQILADKYRINMTAGSEKRIDRSSDVADALS